MQLLELRMTTDLATAIPAEIDFNFEELEAELQKQLHHYNTLVVTEDTIKEGKEDRANLRKLREAIETRRKEVKKQCEAPYKAFEAKVKRLTALIDAPIAAIDSQVKTFEEQEREQKRSEIAAAYDELVPAEIRVIIPLERILDNRWLNKGTSMKSIREDIEIISKRTKVDITFIEAAVDPMYLTAVRAEYIKTLDVNRAMDHQADLKAAEERFRDQEKARAERAAQAAARAGRVPQAEEKPAVAVQEPVRQPAPAPMPRTEEKRYLLRLEFPTITRGQADALKAFLSANNIEYINITNN